MPPYQLRWREIQATGARGQPCLTVLWSLCLRPGRAVVDRAGPGRRPPPGSVWAQEHGSRASWVTTCVVSASESPSPQEGAERVKDSGSSCITWASDRSSSYPPAQTPQAEPSWVGWTAQCEVLSLSRLTRVPPVVTQCGGQSPTRVRQGSVQGVHDVGSAWTGKEGTPARGSPVCRVRAQADRGGVHVGGPVWAVRL